MKGIIEWDQQSYRYDTALPLDLSIPLRSGEHNPNAFGISAPLFEPFRAGGFVGSVAEGGSVNCENLHINAHGNGTHTECVGHISHEKITINQSLKQFFFIAQVVSVPLEQQGDDLVVTLASLQNVFNGEAEALALRTLPNDDTKLTRKYSGNNPPYVEPALCGWLKEKGVKHLLLDLPSVDPEMDEGRLSAHHAFWNYPEAPRMDATITEMIYVPAPVADGIYLLNLQIAALETDASPSKPVLYKLEEITR